MPYRIEIQGHEYKKVVYVKPGDDLLEAVNRIVFDAPLLSLFCDNGLTINIVHCEESADEVHNNG